MKHLGVITIWLLFLLGCGQDQARTPAHRGFRDQRPSWQPDLCEDGTLIALGTVEDLTSFSSVTEGGRRIESEALIRLFRVVSGDRESGSMITVIFEGGTDAGITSVVTGQPHFQVGSNYFLAWREASLGGSVLLLYWSKLQTDSEKRLPGLAEMQSVWQATCRENAQGVHPAYQFDWVFPSGVSMRGFELLGWTTLPR